jgi:hypothetical protein
MPATDDRTKVYRLTQPPKVYILVETRLWRRATPGTWPGPL